MTMTTDRSACTHGKALHCVRCETGLEDLVEAYVEMARRELHDDPAAVRVATALIREADGPYLDGLGPEEAARLAVDALRRAGVDLSLPAPSFYGWCETCGQPATDVEFEL